MLRNLSRELTPDGFTLFALSHAEYIRWGFSELGVSYLEILETLAMIPKYSIRILRDIKNGVDDPKVIINTYRLNPEVFYKFLRKMKDLGLVSYDGRKVKITEKGRRFYETLIEFVVDPLSDLLKVIDEYCTCNIHKKRKEEERESIWLPLDDLAVRQYYEYLKKLEEEEKSS